MGARKTKSVEGMKRGLIISLSVHLGLIALLFGPLTGRATMISAGKIYEVSLISLPSGFPGQQGPPPGNEEPADATLTAPKASEPAKETLRLPSEKKNQKKAPKDKELPLKKKEGAGTTKAAQGASSTSKSGLHSLLKGGKGPGGGSAQSGFSSELQLDIENFEFSYYLVAVRNKVSSGWNPPSGLTTTTGAVRTVIFFRIERNGELSDVKIESPSGVAFFDQSALRAVLRAEPFPPLPRGFAEKSLGIHFGFEYVQ